MELLDVKPKTTLQLNKSFISESSNNMKQQIDEGGGKCNNKKKRADQHSLAWIKLMHMCASMSTFPVSPTTDISCSFLLPSANMQRSSIPREPLSNSTITYASSMISGTWTKVGYLQLKRFQGIKSHERKYQALQCLNCQQSPNLKSYMCLDSRFYSLIDRTLNSFR